MTTSSSIDKALLLSHLNVLQVPLTIGDAGRRLLVDYAKLYNITLTNRGVVTSSPSPDFETDEVIVMRPHYS